MFQLFQLFQMKGFNLFDGACALKSGSGAATMLRQRRRRRLGPSLILQLFMGYHVAFTLWRYSITLTKHLFVCSIQQKWKDEHAS
jgi:hypothetical protein